MNRVNYIESVDNENLKVLKSGIDTRKCKNVGGGVDYLPEDDIEVYIEQVNNNPDDNVIIKFNDGVEKIAKAGEYRIYATKDGEAVNEIHLKNDGTLTIYANSDIVIYNDKSKIELDGNEELVTLNEGTDYAVLYSKLETEFNNLKDKFNDLVTSYNSHTHSGVQSGGSSTGTPSGVALPSTADITQCKQAVVKL